MCLLIFFKAFFEEIHTEPDVDVEDDIPTSGASITLVFCKT